METILKRENISLGGQLNMAKKIIPGKRKTGIISNDTLDMLNKSIRNNYALFGDRANDIKAYCIRLKNLVYGESINLDDVKVSRYTIKKDSDGELICKKDRATKYPNISIDPAAAEISIRNLYDFNINHIDKSESTDSSVYDDYIYEILHDYNSDIRTLHSNVFFSLISDNSISIDAQTKFITSSTNCNSQLINYCKLPKNKVSLGDNKDINIIIIFTAVKSAPLVRIYNGDDEKITSNIVDKLNTILDFEDEDCIYNSYYSKYDYCTEERKITNMSNGIESMKYDVKIDDIVSFLRGERYIEDPIVYDILYENENGFSAEYFERKDSEMVNGSYDIVKKYFYKGVVLFQHILSRDHITGNITFDERINLTAKESEEIENKNPYVDKFFKYIIPLRYSIDFGIEILKESFDMDTFTVLKSTTDDRVVMYANHINNIASMKVETYHNDEYAMVTFNYSKSNISKDVIQMLFDNDENVMFIHKSSAPFCDTIVCKRVNKYVRSKTDYFTRTDYKDGNGYDVVKYSGVEGQFTFYMKGKKAISIVAFDSPIYSINDEFVYIRDMYGVPEKIYIK